MVGHMIIKISIAALLLISFYIQWDSGDRMLYVLWRFRQVFYSIHIVLICSLYMNLPFDFSVLTYKR